MLLTEEEKYKCDACGVEEPLLNPGAELPTNWTYGFDTRPKLRGVFELKTLGPTPLTFCSDACADNKEAALP